MTEFFKIQWKENTLSPKNIFIIDQAECKVMLHLSIKSRTKAIYKL